MSVDANECVDGGSLVGEAERDERAGERSSVKPVSSGSNRGDSSRIGENGVGDASISKRCNVGERLRTLRGWEPGLADRLGYLLVLYSRGVGVRDWVG